MTLYEEYKPFRNYMRRFDRLSALIDVWRYSLHIVERMPLLSGLAEGFPPLFGPLRQKLYPWDLDVLAREAVMHGGNKEDRRLSQWQDLATAVNHIRRVDNESFSAGHQEPDVMLNMLRIAHRQFPWQNDRGLAPIMRAYKVFGEAAVDAIVFREFGMTMRQLILLGFAVGGHFHKQPGMSMIQDYNVLNISLDSSRKFFNRMTVSMSDLKEKLVDSQSYDSSWSYTWNPLEATPLIVYDKLHPERVVCPIPRYLTRRVSSGVFYDLVRSSDFDNPFGNSFQRYIGDIICVTCPAPKFATLTEQAYYIDGKRFDGVDWILSDNTGHLFIEAKTKRLTLLSKTRSDEQALDKDILIVAEAVVQHYRNINHALAGKTRWENDGLPVYPLILTLEDMYLFSPKVQSMLNGHVIRLLREASLSPHVLEAMPFTIASASEFEVASQIVAQVGIHYLFTEKTGGVERSWSLLPFLQNRYREELQGVNWMIFSEEFERLVPEWRG